MRENRKRVSSGRSSRGRAEEVSRLDIEVREFRRIIEGLRESRESGDSASHVEWASKACKQSRRVRFLLGPPEMIQDVAREVVSLFCEAAREIATEVCDDGRLSLYRRNINERADKISERLVAFAM
jgi:hypothetical protein